MRMKENFMIERVPQVDFFSRYHCGSIADKTAIYSG